MATSVLKIWVSILLFGALGAVSRYGISLLIPHHDPAGWPWATFLINVAGSLALGVTLALAARNNISMVWREGVGTGFLGAFTTFSAYSMETVRLVQSGSVLLAVLYAFSSILLGVCAALAGMTAARKREA